MDTRWRLQAALLYHRGAEESPPPCTGLGRVCDACSPGASAAYATDDTLESSIKAAYLYKLGAFVEWPQSAFQSPTSAVNLCLTGDDPFDGTLDKAVDGQRIGEHPIVVRRLKAVARDSGCQILYVGGSNQQALAQALEHAVRGTAVLTVTDTPQVDDTTGIIQFVIKDNRVRFDIDEQAASANGLTISSKLLSLAVSVRPRL